MSMYPGVSIITLGVADVARATRFYTNLGWRHSHGASNESITFFTLNNVVLGIFGRDALAEDSGLPAGGRNGFSGMTLAQNHGSEAAVRQALASAVAAGATTLKEPQPTFWGGYHATFADPDGHVWELAHNPFFRLGPDGTLTLPD